MDPNTLKLLMGSAGAGAVADKVYIEDVFSTYLYTGTGASQTITNGIDLSGKGGLVWIKSRSAVDYNLLDDTARGAGKFLWSNESDAQQSNGLSSFSSSGFSTGSTNDQNRNLNNYVSWTFRKAAKFFDVVTYTGNGANRTISHNLGSVPGTIFIKRTDSAADWQVYHRSLANTEYLVLNSTAAKATGATRWNSTTPTSTEFSLGTDATVNANGGTYVAYLFAHDAGGFGDSGNDNVISCGSVTTNGSGQIPTVNLGWEPQWLIMKNTTSAGNWDMYDTMRGWVSQDQNQFNRLSANVSSAEATGVNGLAVITSTGFRSNTLNFGASETYIYIAIRRGPMKTPTDATKVFTSVTNTNNSTNGVVTTGFPVDMHISISNKDQNGDNKAVEDRLRGLGNTNTAGASPNLKTESTAAEVTNQNPWFYQAWNTTIVRGGNGTGTSPVSWFFRRAPGFLDVVAYTGTGSARTVSHNLGVVPEFCIVKRRNSAAFWPTWSSVFTSYQYVALNETSAKYDDGSSNQTFSFTSSDWSIGTTFASVNASGGTYIAYLFATCPGVSKVGSYTGSGTTKQIDCGFTNGARFVLIKRTDSTGDWYVWDTARGIVSGNDPFLFLNSTAAENTSTDYIDPLSTGFEISSTAPAAINANGGSFIFLAVA